MVPECREDVNNFNALLRSIFSLYFPHPCLASTSICTSLALRIQIFAFFFIPDFLSKATSAHEYNLGITFMLFVRTSCGDAQCSTEVICFWYRLSGIFEKKVSSLKYKQKCFQFCQISLDFNSFLVFATQGGVLLTHGRIFLQLIFFTQNLLSKFDFFTFFHFF